MPPTAGYYKRYRMEADLHGRRLVPLLPAGFDWVPWDDTLLDLHAQVKAKSFAEELDSEVFPCLGDLAGCTTLMHAIREKSGFCPAATWLVGNRLGVVGTVQGLIDKDGYGAVQNLGVVPAFRGRGLGGALLLKALDGFRAGGRTPGTPGSDVRQPRGGGDVPAARVQGPKNDLQAGGRSHSAVRRLD